MNTLFLPEWERMLKFVLKKLYFFAFLKLRSSNLIFINVIIHTFHAYSVHDID
ncbi:unknown protein [Parachlamydia acanthamoebae UV-7]|uniref:Uncharacterized protein n=2 Tax=Parachlamydia acanthamoebae TaxID=83552 RepID=F8KWU1_PARAV|nr:hypothetical protein DB43_FM00020 [Parachlamydia acanthamoebae]CCB86393.1 unknown protein [Parachlamydia acanthamoebae UV-7]